MNDQQLYLAIGVPILFNGIALTIAVTTLNSRISDVNSRLNEVATSLNRRIDDLGSSLRREMDMNFKVVVDKLGELDTRITKLEERR